MTTEKKVSTTVYLTPDQREQLRVLSLVSGVPIAVYVREGIDLVLDRHRRFLDAD